MGHRGSRTSESSALRIVSYNVRYFGHALRGLASTVGTKRRIAAALLSLEPLPDVICLQEVEDSSLRSRWAHRQAKEGQSQLEAFMEHFEAAAKTVEREFPYEGFYFPAHRYHVGKLPLYTTGLAVLVNLGRLAVDAHNVDSPKHVTHHHLHRWRSRKQSRICAHLKLQDGRGKTFHVFNTHLSLPTPWAKGFWQQKDKMGHGVNQLHEARAVSEYIASLANGEPFIVAGDFNSPPGSPVYQYLTSEGGLQGAQESLGLLKLDEPRYFPTAGFMRLRMHLDHLFSGGGVRWLDLDGTARFGDLSGRFYGLSDHVPLVARFAVEG